jgi:hypothetical protein
MSQVAATPTPVTADEIGLEFLRQVPELSRTSLGMLIAHWAAETGWGKAMIQNNVGNRKSDGKSGDWSFFSCTERVNRATAEKMIDADPAHVTFEHAEDAENGKDSVVIRIDPEHPWSRFAAFPTLAAGVADYLAMMRRTFPSSWAALLRGDQDAYAQELKSEGYYTATVEDYQKLFLGVLASVNRKASVALAAAPEEASPPFVSSRRSGSAGVAMLVLLLAGAYLWRRKGHR